MIVILILIVLFAVFQVVMTGYLTNNPDLCQLDVYTWENDDFRVLQLEELVASLPVDGNLDYDVLTTSMIEQGYDLARLKETFYHKGRLMERRGADYQELCHVYESIFVDLKHFPVPESMDVSMSGITLENEWTDKWTYGGKRGHEGCDIMGAEREQGFCPVLSMNNGVVEKVGWLEKGGWRIDVRAPPELYLYYTYLYSYSRDWQGGDVVKTKELLGFTGDTGCSAAEGMVGNFDVHLHVGFYIKANHYDELSVNPYWVLRYLGKNRTEVKFQAVHDGYATRM